MDGSAECLDRPHLLGVDHHDGVLVAAGHVEAAISGEQQIVGIGADLDGGLDLQGGRVDDAHRATGPIGDEHRAAIRTQLKVARSDLHLDLPQNLAIARIKGHHMAGLTSGAPIGSIQNRPGRMVRQASPVDGCGRQSIRKLGHGRPAQPTLAVIKHVNRCDLGLLTATSIATRDEQTPPLRAPRQTHPRGAQGDSLEDGRTVGLGHHEAMRVETTVEADQHTPIG